MVTPADVVRDVARVLGLDAIQHSVVGDEEKRGISGGQRKRVNIGMEMVADPSLLFLAAQLAKDRNSTELETVDLSPGVNTY